MSEEEIARMRAAARLLNAMAGTLREMLRLNRRDADLAAFAMMGVLAEQGWSFEPPSACGAADE